MGSHSQRNIGSGPPTPKGWPPGYVPNEADWRLPSSEPAFSIALVESWQYIFGGTFVVWLLLNAPARWFFVAVVAALFLVAVVLAVRYQPPTEADKAAAKERFRQQKWHEHLATRPLAQMTQARQPLAAARRIVDRAGDTYLAHSLDGSSIIAASREETLVCVGPMGSGKTIGMAAPAAALHRGPVILASTKIDLLDLTARARAAVGRLWLFDPMHSVSDSALDRIGTSTGTRIYRLHWSPLLTATDWDRAKLAALGLIASAQYGKGQSANAHHWDTLATRVLAPMLLAAALHHRGTMDWPRRWIANRDIEAPWAILEAAREVIDDPVVLTGIEIAIDNLSSRNKDRSDHSSDVWSTLETHLDALEWTWPIVEADRLNFDPDAFVRSTDTIYFAGSPDEQQASSPIFVAMLDAIFKATVRYDNESPFVPSKRPSVFVCLDEAANIAPTPYLFRYLSLGRSHGFQLWAFLQSVSQAAAVWGEQGRDIVSYPAIKVLFGGIADRATNEAFEMMCGDTYREYRSQSRQLSGGENWGESQQSTYGAGWPSTSRGSQSGGQNGWSQGENIDRRKERRFSAADISSLPKGQALIVKNQQSQITQVSDPAIIKGWIEIMNSPGTARYFPPPVELQRPSIALGPVEALIEWNREYYESATGGHNGSEDASSGATRQGQTQRHSQRHRIEG